MVSTFDLYLTQIAIVIIISVVTGRENNYANIASNASITVLAGGTLLFEQKIIGFFLLVYGIFLLGFSVKEYEKSESSTDDSFGIIIKILGHYLIVSSVLIAILFLEYRPEVINFIEEIISNFLGSAKTTELIQE